MSSIDRKQEILTAATKSFSLFGFKATTMDQVAKIANVGKGTIYTFFKNKDELFHDIVLSMIQEMKHEAELVIDSEKSFEENAHAALMKMLEFRDQHDLLARLIAEEREMQTPTVVQVMRAIEQEIVDFIAERMQNAIDKNEMEPVNTKLASYLLFKSYMAFVIEWQKTHDQPLSEEEITTFFQQTLFQAFAKKKK